ncbi:MAG: helix-turn-helix domain-containing protein [Acidimicrobiales bacterium]|nr:helix-turn-helix domain-containing protein [Acidimicrobiales bacterium]
MPEELMAEITRLPRLTYSTREVAVMLGVSRPTVDRLVRDGVLPSVDLGVTRRTLIPAWAVERLVGESSAEHGGEAA